MTQSGHWFLLPYVLWPLIRVQIVWIRSLRCLLFGQTEWEGDGQEERNYGKEERKRGQKVEKGRGEGRKMKKEKEGGQAKVFAFEEGLKGLKWRYDICHLEKDLIGEALQSRCDCFGVKCCVVAMLFCLKLSMCFSTSLGYSPFHIKILQTCLHTKCIELVLTFKLTAFAMSCGLIL